MTDLYEMILSYAKTAELYGYADGCASAHEGDERLRWDARAERYRKAADELRQKISDKLLAIVKSESQ